MDTENRDISRFMARRNALPHQPNNTKATMVNAHVLFAKRFANMFNWVDGKMVMYDAIPGTANPMDSYDDGFRQCIVSDTIKLTVS